VILGVCFPMHMEMSCNNR